ncbi:hypothetical protein [Streptomyces sp. NPDC058495]|uniref:hypothetical protein n=1 Tax=unclassified Streptomyces TaxID=2593676 RepID=UPI00366400EC
MALAEALLAHPDVTDAHAFPTHLTPEPDLTFTAQGGTWALTLHTDLDGYLPDHLPGPAPAGPLSAIVAPAILAHPSYRDISALTSTTADTLTLHRPGHSHHTLHLTRLA